MSSSRLTQLERLFDTGVAVPIAQRRAWLDALDIEPGLRSELERMLAADATASALTRRMSDALHDATVGEFEGKRIGAYRLLRELGRGGVGVVFLAERVDTGFRQQVALKVVHRLAGGDAAQQLRHERQILAELDHPGIARLFDGGETDDGHPYLVMEFVRGEPITLAARARSLDVRARVGLIREVAGAVHFAHQRLIVHRDIKPGNVLLREDGRPVLLDFGIAKLLEPGLDAAVPTQPWFTPAYASPEQRRGDAVSTSTDVYALGLLLCELLSDAQPRIDGDGTVTAPSLVAAHGQRRLFRGDLDRVVARACAVEPQRRYPSADALARDLERYLANEPLSAAPDGIGYRLSKLLRRHPIPAAVVLASVAALSVMGKRLVDERNNAIAAEAVSSSAVLELDRQYRFLAEILSGIGNPGPDGATLSAIGLVDRARDNVGVRLDEDTASRSAIEELLASAYLNAGRYDQVVRLAEASVQHAPPGLSVNVLAFRLRLWARGLLQLNRPAEAMPLLDRAWALLPNPPADPGQADLAARILFSRIMAAKDLPDDSLVRPAVDAALAYAEAHLQPGQPIRALILGEHAAQLESEGRVAELLRLRREVLALMQADPAAYRRDIAYQRINLARALRMAQDYAAARHELDAAEADYRSVLGEGSDRSRADVDLERAELERDAGRIAAAAAAMDRGLAMLEGLGEDPLASQLLVGAEIAAAQGGSVVAQRRLERAQALASTDRGRRQVAATRAKLERMGRK